MEYNVGLLPYSRTRVKDRNQDRFINWSACRLCIDVYKYIIWIDFAFLWIYMPRKWRKRDKLKVAIENMDLNRLPNDQKLDLCRWYFKVGMYFLPFVWAVNTVWFFKEAFVKPPYEQQKQIKKYVIASGVGCLLWAAALASWVTVFQTHRVSWGEMGDSLSFITPLGRP